MSYFSDLMSVLESGGMEAGAGIPPDCEESDPERWDYTRRWFDKTCQRLQALEATYEQAVALFQKSPPSAQPEIRPLVRRAWDEIMSAWNHAARQVALSRCRVSTLPGGKRVEDAVARPEDYGWFGLRLAPNNCFSVSRCVRGRPGIYSIDQLKARALTLRGLIARDRKAIQMIEGLPGKPGFHGQIDFGVNENCDPISVEESRKFFRDPEILRVAARGREDSPHWHLASRLDLWAKHKKELARIRAALHSRGIKQIYPSVPEQPMSPEEAFELGYGDTKFD